MTAHPYRWHLLGLEPGAAFRLGAEGRTGGPVYRVVAGRTADAHAFVDEAGQPVSSTAIAGRNGGSLFVHVLPRESEVKS